ncbi:MAG: LptF/LptG family permease [Spirochaetaceae bacterium]|jgi:lipopolysaccharide export system permease protein|nr:LptF/LptG family permease [Spirochaetaceae bacterium]
MILDRYLVKQFFPVFMVAVSLFVMLLCLIDLFANLVRYLNYEVPLGQMLTVTFYYFPKSLSYALPLSLLFAAAYTLGDLYARNELTSIFSSGIPFRRFCMPLLFIGLLGSVLSFFFEDRIVVPTFKQKNDLSRKLLHLQRTEANSDIVIKARNGQLIYSIDYYDDNSTSLNGISIIEQNEQGEFRALIRSPRATWTGEYWSFTNALIYDWQDGILRVRPLENVVIYREPPDAFRRSAVDVESLSAREAAFLVNDLKAAGLPFTGAQANYYHRFSFPSVSFVIMILSVSMGGRFRKNILLMSLLTSLGAAVIFYVMEMISMMMARLGYIPPIVGAWFPVVVFIAIGMLLLQSAKT